MTEATATFNPAMEARPADHNEEIRAKAEARMARFTSVTSQLREVAVTMFSLPDIGREIFHRAVGGFESLGNRLQARIEPGVTDFAQTLQTGIPDIIANVHALGTRAERWGLSKVAVPVEDRIKKIAETPAHIIDFRANIRQGFYAVKEGIGTGFGALFGKGVEGLQSIVDNLQKKNEGFQQHLAEVRVNDAAAVSEVRERSKKIRDQVNGIKGFRDMLNQMEAAPAAAN